RRRGGDVRTGAAPERADRRGRRRTRPGLRGASAHRGLVGIPCRAVDAARRPPRANARSGFDAFRPPSPAERRRPRRHDLATRWPCGVETRLGLRTSSRSNTIVSSLTPGASPTGRSPDGGLLLPELHALPGARELPADPPRTRSRARTPPPRSEPRSAGIAPSVSGLRLRNRAAGPPPRVP